MYVPPPTEFQSRSFHKPRRATWTHRLAPCPHGSVEGGSRDRRHSGTSSHTDGTTQRASSGKCRIKSPESAWDSPSVKTPITLGLLGHQKIHFLSKAVMSTPHIYITELITTTSILGNCEHWLSIWRTKNFVLFFYGVMMTLYLHSKVGILVCWTYALKYL